jgi:predicted secreted protein/putative hemolysin
MKASGSHGKFGIIGLGIMLILVLLVSGCTQPALTPPGTQIPTATQTIIGMPNPASVYCGQVGGTLEIKKDNSGNEYGMCTFKNGTSCEEWALFRNEGCKPGLTTMPTVEGKKMFTFTEADNGKTGDITRNTRFAVVLPENPTTGFMWNATLSSGLVLQSSDYLQNDTPAGMVGVGGTRTWVILAKDIGNQKFSAISKRAWEPESGNESAYIVNIRVGKV